MNSKVEEVLVIIGLFAVPRQYSYDCAPGIDDQSWIRVSSQSHFLSHSFHCAELRSFRRGCMALRAREDNV